jgi:anti-anti-sigma factor
MVESPAVQEAAREEVDRGVRSVRLDLRDCTVIDSTFSGTLLSIKRQLDEVGGTFTLVSPSSKVLELLEQMGLEDFYTIDVAERPPGDWKELSAGQPPLGELEKTVRGAHDELARMPGAVGDAFKGVAAALHKN